MKNDKRANKDESELLEYAYAKLTEAPVLAKRRLTRVVGGNEEKLDNREFFYRIKRHVDAFIDNTASGKENRLVLVPGLRGLGKTTALLQIYEYISETKKIDKDRILYFSADELKDFLGGNISDVVRIFVEGVHKNTYAALDRQLFILIDEVHFDPNWSLSAKVIYDKADRIFMILTGSSALGIEMGMDLARRAKKEQAFPLSFAEFLSLKYGLRIPDEIPSNILSLLLKPTEAACRRGDALWNEFRKKAVSIGKPLEEEFKRFLFTGGFPFCIGLDERSVYEKCFGMIERISERDVYTVQSFNSETRNLITRIIYHLALQSPGGTSDAKISERLGASSKLVRSILDVLEKTHLVFSVKPHGSAGKVLRKPWKYYFLSPSLISSLRYKLGSLHMEDRNIFGSFAEHGVASSLFRMKELNLIPGFHYDSQEGGADFLIETGESTIPVEVGFGEKSSGQVRRSMNSYKSSHGILVSDEEGVSFNNRIVRVPLIYFALY